MSNINSPGNMTPEQLMKLAASFGGKDAADPEKAINAVSKQLSDEKRQKLNEVLSDKSALEKLLQSPEAQRLMKKFGLVCPIRKANPYRRMQKAIRTNSTAENLVKREFEMHGPRSVLLTDITYIPLNGAFCYLSTILDGCTKQVLSYVLSESLEVDFVLETVQKMVHQHGISLKKESILHSDQGCHYTCIKFIQLVKNSSLRQSMSRKGNCWDNAPQESFFGHMKDELAEKIPNWTCFADVQRSIDDWMDYYNNDRYQWDLAKLSPNEYYRYLTTGRYPC